jgi:phosphoribosylglycinamide formyltransferase-1
MLGNQPVAKKMSNLFNIAVFISGTGSNLKSIIEKQEKYRYKVGLVISNNENAPGLEFAKVAGIDTFTFVWDKNDKQLLAVTEQVQKHQCDLIVLAGFMKILPEGFITTFENKIINIHPSLLPKYPGLHTHQRVVDNKDKVHGATVHYVNADLDAGKIITQTTINVSENTNAQALGKQLLFREHSLLPYTIALIGQNRVKWHADKLYFDHKILNQVIIIDD